MDEQTLKKKTGETANLYFRDYPWEKAYDLWRSFDKGLAKDLSLFITGQMYAREKLPHPTRQLVAISALTALERKDELRMHMWAGLERGTEARGDNRGHLPGGHLRGHARGQPGAYGAAGGFKGTAASGPLKSKYTTTPNLSGQAVFKTACPRSFSVYFLAYLLAAPGRAEEAGPPGRRPARDLARLLRLFPAGQKLADARGLGGFQVAHDLARRAALHQIEYLHGHLVVKFFHHGGGGRRPHVGEHLDQLLQALAALALFGGHQLLQDLLHLFKFADSGVHFLAQLVQVLALPLHLGLLQFHVLALLFQDFYEARIISDDLGVLVLFGVRLFVRALILGLGLVLVRGLGGFLFSARPFYPRPARRWARAVKSGQARIKARIRPATFTARPTVKRLCRRKDFHKFSLRTKAPTAASSKSRPSALICSIS